MTISELTSNFRESVRSSAAANFNISLDQIAAETPPKTELGDVAFPIAFELAKRIKQETGEKANPRAIAEKLKENIQTIDGVGRVEIAGPGYLNVFFDRASFLTANANSEPLSISQDIEQEKICVEHTSVNPNKAAHIGHVSNCRAWRHVSANTQGDRKTGRDAELHR